MSSDAYSIQMDAAVVVAPKKKFLAAQAEAAASDITAASKSTASTATTLQNAGNSDGRGGESKSSATSSHATSYSVRDNAPAGARSADDDENVKFQNAQLYAANQVWKAFQPETRPAVNKSLLDDR